MLLPPLVEGRLVRRRNRFVAEVELPKGMGLVEAHCPNTGSMMGCRESGSRVWLSAATNPLRKLAWTWELVEADGTMVGIHTGRSNGLVREAIEAGAVPELAGYPRIRGEVPYGENSRIDLLLEADGRRPCYVEVKNVTAAVGGGVGYFPDAITARGTKHLREMMALVARGDRAVLCFCVQRGDVAMVRPADHIDPLYGKRLREAMAVGVEVFALGAVVDTDRIALARRVPVAT